MQDFIKINKDDNVAVALKPISKGTTLNVAGTEVTTIEDIPQGHKFAIKPVKKGDEVVKYGFRIGYAQADVEVGGWIHTHNLKTALGELLDYTYNPEGHEDVKPTEEAFFEGYMRENSKVGVVRFVFLVAVSVYNRKVVVVILLTYKAARILTEGAHLVAEGLRIADKL